MPAEPYATGAELAAWLNVPEGGLGETDEVARLLMRASETLDRFVLTAFSVDSDTGLPSDPNVAETLRDAACAQVEFWRTVTEAHEVQGDAHQKISAGKLSRKLPPQLAPRAKGILELGGLLEPSGPPLASARRFFMFENG